LEEWGMPSDPGTFGGYICFKASLTSTALKFLVNAWFIEGVTFGWMAWSSSENFVG